MYSVWIQVYILVTMLVWGLLLGIIFDLYRFLLPTSRVKGIAQYIFDSIFWLIITIFTFVIMVFANFGDVRLYLILGIALGFTVYSILFSKWIIKILNIIKGAILKLAKIVKRFLLAILNVLKNLYGLIIKIIAFFLYPILFIFKRIFLPIIDWLQRPIKKIITKIKRK